MYSKEELINCICECMQESLPLEWNQATMRVSASKEQIDATYRYKTQESDTEYKFKPNNFVAPMNAANFLIEQIRQEGRIFQSLEVILQRNGDYEITLVK